MRSDSQSTMDLTREEQARVRAALQFLRRKLGGWPVLAKALKANRYSIRDVGNGRPVTAIVAFRLARFLKMSMDDLLAGKFPPAGSCPYCGHVAESAESSS